MNTNEEYFRDKDESLDAAYLLKELLIDYASKPKEFKDGIIVTISKVYEMETETLIKLFTKEFKKDPYEYGGTFKDFLSEKWKPRNKKKHAYCKRLAKQKYKVWPSAYASGFVTQCYYKK